MCMNLLRRPRHRRSAPRAATIPSVLIFLLLCLPFLASGCASSEYWRDRRNDALDIFTVTTGLGVGAKARVGPMHAGLLLNHDMEGLRSGMFQKFVCRDDLADVMLDLDCTLVAEDHCVQFEHYHDRYAANRRTKMYIAAGGCSLSDIPLDGSRQRRTSWVQYSPCVCSPQNSCASYYSEIEICAGLGGSLRLGFNPGELLDFLVGWVGLDFYGDDISSLPVAPIPSLVVPRPSPEPTAPAGGPRLSPESRVGV